MKTVVFCVDVGIAGVEPFKEEVGFEDNATEEEIGKYFQVWKDNLFCNWWDYKENL